MTENTTAASGAASRPSAFRTDACEEACEEAFVRDFCPYSGSPDPLVVWRAAWQAALAAPAAQEADPAPIDMVLHCPACGMQHIDAPETLPMAYAIGAAHFSPGYEPWENPPHRSHLCHGCSHIWRPADVPTNGVAAVQTKGKADSPIAARPPRPQADAGAVAVPEGWRLVPAKATQEILDAIRRVVDLETSDPEDHRYDDGTSTADALYEALLAAAPQAPAAAGAQIEWDPLPEDSGERARFDRDLGLLYRQDPRVAITTHLSIWAGTKGNGQFGQQCAILANEVARLRLAAPAPAAGAAPTDADLPDVEDMAHSALQEALSFGLGHDVLHRWMRAVMDKTVAALGAAAPAQATAPTDAAHKAAVDHAHEILGRQLYHRDGDYFVNVNRSGAEAMHVRTVATIVHAALISAAAPAQEAADAARLDYLQRGATVELFPGRLPPHAMHFRIGGLWRTEHTDIRLAIDAARARQEGSA